MYGACCSLLLLSPSLSLISHAMPAQKHRKINNKVFIVEKKMHRARGVAERNSQQYVCILASGSSIDIVAHNVI